MSDLGTRVTRPPAAPTSRVIAPVEAVPDYARACVSLRRAAVMLTTRTDTVKRLIDAGQIAAYRDGRAWRVSTESIRSYVAERAAEYCGRAGIALEDHAA